MRKLLGKLGGAIAGPFLRVVPLLLLIPAAFLLALPEAARAQIWVSSGFTVTPGGLTETATCSTSAVNPNNPAQPPSAAAADYNQFVAYCKVTPSVGAVIHSAQCPAGSRGASGNPTAQCSVTFEPQRDVTYTVNSNHYYLFAVDPLGTVCGQPLFYEFCFSDPLGYYSMNPSAPDPWPAVPNYPTDTASIAENETCTAGGGTCTPQNIPYLYCLSGFTVFGVGICTDGIIARQSWPLAQTSAAYSCNLPTQETTVFKGWDVNQPSMADWEQTPSDSNGDSFVQKQIKEVSAGPAGDTCWFPGSAIALMTGIPPPPVNWFVNPDGTWGPDVVGWYANNPPAVSYYRAQGKAGCAFAAFQQMQMQCPDGEFHNYGPVNTLVGIIGATTVSSARSPAGGTGNLETRRF